MRKKGRWSKNIQAMEEIEEVTLQRARVIGEKNRHMARVLIRVLEDVKKWHERWSWDILNKTHPRVKMALKVLEAWDGETAKKWREILTAHSPVWRAYFMEVEKHVF